jgi:intracellular septation protein
VKFFVDFFPVILFFVAYKVSDIFVATGVAIAATFMQIGWTLARRRKVTGMQWVSLAIIAVFGGATLLLRDETFIKWKSVMSEGGGLELPEPIWTKLAVAWGVFFIFKGTLNLYVAYAFPTEVWVNFKLFGGIGLMLAFVIAQALWLSRYLPEDDAKDAQPQPVKGDGP